FRSVITVEVGTGAGGTGIRTGSRFGQAEAGQRLAGDEVGKPTLFLFGSAERQDGIDPQSDTGLQRNSDRLVYTTELFDRQAQASNIISASHVFGRCDDTEQPQLTRFVHDGNGKMVFGAPALYVRLDFGLGELADHAAKRFMFSCQI